MSSLPDLPPKEVFRRLVGSLVLSFDYDEAAGHFVLVVARYDAGGVGMTTFAAMTLMGATRFVREHGRVRAYRKAVHSFRCEEHPPVEIEWQNSGGAKGKRWVELGFGGAFGELRCSYSEVRLLRRESQAVRGPDSFRYVDLVSGEEFDFYRPFPR